MSVFEIETTLHINTIKFIKTVVRKSLMVAVNMFSVRSLRKKYVD